MSIVKTEMIKYYQEIYHGLQKNPNLAQVSEHVSYSILLALNTQLSTQTWFCEKLTVTDSSMSFLLRSA